MEGYIKIILLICSLQLTLPGRHADALGPFRSSDNPLEWCPSDLCNCSPERLPWITTTPDVDLTPASIYCESTNFEAVLRDLPGGLLFDLTVYVTPETDDRMIPSLAFRNFTNLQSLDLSGNAIREIEGGAFHGAIQLKLLWLSGNLLQSLHEDTFSGAAESESSFVYGLPNLVELHLDNNEISTIEDRAFSSLTSLRLLDLSRNRIEHIGNNTFDGLLNVRTMLLAGNALTHIDAGLWAALLQLRELSLSENSINFVDPDTFAGLENLFTLRLDRNDIVDFQDPGLSIPSVSSLNLSHNSIEVLQYNFFYNVYNLTWVNLDDNDIASVAYGAFQNSQLRELYLNNNQMGDIIYQSFLELDWLEHLELKNNRITRIGEHKFGHLLSLKRLILDNNELSSLSPNIFSPEFNPRARDVRPTPDAVQELRISNNRMIQPVTEILSAMPQIEHYNMSGNMVFEVEENNFPVHGLLVLDLSSNQISRIAVGAFVNLAFLQELYLADNNIQTISRTAFASHLPIVLSAYNNPLTCDCRLKWLVEEISVLGQASSCTAPTALEGASLTALESSDFHCPIEWNMNVSTRVMGRQGSEAMLICPVVLQERITIEWTVEPGEQMADGSSGDSLERDSSATVTYPNGTLHILEVLQSSDTNYTCRATNNVDTKIFPVLLHVIRRNPPQDLTNASESTPDGIVYIKYGLGSAAGAVFLVGFVGVLLAIFIPARRTPNKQMVATEKQCDIDMKDGNPE